MVDLDPIAWLDRHPRLFRYVLYPTVTIGFWAGMLLVDDQMWKGYLLGGVAITTFVGIGIVLIPPCERFARWFANLAFTKLVVRVAARSRSVLASHGLGKPVPGRGRHKLNYMSYHNPKHQAYAIVRRLAVE